MLIFVLYPNLTVHVSSVNGWYSLSVLFVVSGAGGRLGGFRIRWSWSPVIVSHMIFRMVSPAQGLQYGVSPKVSRIGSRLHGLQSWSPMVARVVSRMVSRRVSSRGLPYGRPSWISARTVVRVVSYGPRAFSCLRHSFLRCHPEVPVGNARQRCSPGARRLPPSGLSKMLCRVVCCQGCNECVISL